MRTAWNKGLTKETDNRVMKYALSGTGKPRHLGRKISDVIKEKIRQKHKGRIITPEWREKISCTLKRRFINKELKRIGRPSDRINIAKLNASGKNIKIGEKNHKWKGGITPIHHKIRNSPVYKQWRTAVFTRDDYTCKNCFKKGVYLEADHIKPFAFYPELRFVVDNGRTLCVQCHCLLDNMRSRFVKTGDAL